MCLIIQIPGYHSSTATSINAPAIQQKTTDSEENDENDSDNNEGNSNHKSQISAIVPG
jgi:hypothetical protein